MSSWRYGTKQEELLKEKFFNKVLLKDIQLVPGSGNRFYAKEDLTNNQVLCQVKSTKSFKYTISQVDVKKLVIHSFSVFKFPVFIVNFSKLGVQKVLFLKSTLADKKEFLVPNFESDFPEAHSKVIKPDQTPASYIFDDIEMVLVDMRHLK
jgi:hypothetical protein